MESSPSATCDTVDTSIDETLADGRRFFVRSRRETTPSDPPTSWSWTSWTSSRPNTSNERERVRIETRDNDSNPYRLLSFPSSTYAVPSVCVARRVKIRAALVMGVANHHHHHLATAIRRGTDRTARCPRCRVLDANRRTRPVSRRRRDEDARLPRTVRATHAPDSACVAPNGTASHADVARTLVRTTAAVTASAI